MEVERWIRLWEWRSLTKMEICAFGTHWKVVGDAMGIDYSNLRHGPRSFKDGLAFFEDIKEWAEQYELEHMVPDKYNHQLAEETTRILLANAPDVLKPYGQNMVTALMDDRLRCAMMYDEPPPIYLRVVKAIFGMRKLISRWLLLPRPYALRVRPVTDNPDLKTGRYFMTEYENEPW
ncbi:hypothetical protein EJ07DRAFT_171690 [Lizonia empirigonia]|nr:hypothetical protein EJ07DRAFT_171690 [Lizonia empirigonia]